MIEKGKAGKRINGVIPIKEDIIVFDEPITDNLPGINASKINPDIEIEGGGGGSDGVADTKSFTVNGTTVGAESTFEGFGFRPKKVEIQGLNTIGLGYFDDEGNKTDITTTLTANSSHLLWLETGGLVINGFLKEFTDDGFIVTWDRTDATILSFNATCFTNI